MPQFRIREAAELLATTDDTIRRWVSQGRLAASEDASGRLVIDGTELAKEAVRIAAPAGDDTGVRRSARNRFVGLVTGIRRDTVMAQVEIQAGPHRVVSLMSTEAVDDLQLEVGDRAVAFVKATAVVVEVVDS
jgi:molybdopterin-binding protein